MALALRILRNVYNLPSSFQAIKVQLMERVDWKNEKTLHPQKLTSIAVLPSWQRFLEFVTCHLGVKQRTSNPKGLSQIEQSGNEVKEEKERWKSESPWVPEYRSIRIHWRESEWLIESQSNVGVSAKYSIDIIFFWLLNPKWNYIRNIIFVSLWYWRWRNWRSEKLSNSLKVT